MRVIKMIVNERAVEEVITKAIKCVYLVKSDYLIKHKLTTATCSTKRKIIKILIDAK